MFKRSENNRDRDQVSKATVIDETQKYTESKMLYKIDILIFQQYPTQKKNHHEDVYKKKRIVKQ